MWGGEEPNKRGSTTIKSSSLLKTLNEQSWQAKVQRFSSWWLKRYRKSSGGWEGAQQSHSYHVIRADLMGRIKSLIKTKGRYRMEPSGEGQCKDPVLEACLMGWRSSEDTTVATTVCAHKESKRDNGYWWGMGNGKKKQGERNGFEDEYTRLPAFSVRFSVFERKRKKRIWRIRGIIPRLKKEGLLYYSIMLEFFLSEKYSEIGNPKPCLVDIFPLLTIFYCRGIKYETMVILFLIKNALNSTFSLPPKKSS